MAKNNKMPVIRFSGYTNVWEQYKLSDITEVIMGQSPSSKNYTDNPNDDILVQGNADLKDGKVVPRLWTKEITKTIDKGGIILTVRAPVGDVAKTDYKVVLGRGVAGIKGNDYIYQFLQKLQYNRYWVSLSSGSTFESINSNDIKDLIIDIPSIEEQTKISMLLNNVNSIITLHQRKLEKLKLTKKALLQKLFPQNGSKLPELRFKGFTAAWEQCKLSDITEIVMGQSPSSKNYTDNPNDNILVQGNADLKDGKVVPRLWTKEITKTLDKDGIVLTVRAPVGDVAKTDYKVVLGRGVAGIKGNDYIYQFLQKLQNNRYWVSLSSGSTFESINSNDIKDLIIDIPSIEEQTKISMLLNNVNSIITLHQRKLEMLKNVKKGLLQKMFV